MTEPKCIVGLKKSQKGIIAELITENENILRKLMSMGVLPGLTIEVIQTYPAYVFKIGHTQIAVDKEIASAILVNVLSNN